MEKPRFYSGLLAELIALGLDGLGLDSQRIGVASQEFQAEAVLDELLNTTGCRSDLTTANPSVEIPARARIVAADNVTGAQQLQRFS